MKKLLFITLFIANTGLFAQSKTSIGLNMPLLIDNQLDLTFQQSIHKRMRLIATVGGSANTRGKFNNGRNNYNYQQPYNQDYYVNVTSDDASGVYGKVGINFTFNLPDFFNAGTNKDNSNFKFYVGPLLGVAKYSQVAQISKTYNPKVDTKGVIITEAKTTTETKTEKGTLTGTGFAAGFTIAANKDISADLGLEYLGFERKSELQYQSHTPGMGAILTLRVNYNFGAKK
jgi:hypothetical protein